MTKFKRPLKSVKPVCLLMTVFGLVAFGGRFFFDGCRGETE
ncbi:hypothetical protein ES705_33405 [subsurface metagenome]